ncbi:Uncharacterized protein dnl_14810 [Desulfonema limicola]|uniref:Uncharacterized protein n=2 Tax=Desulfonema limicola TaxID=45656 RepID=A0A975GFE9_9BACT|nr:Uncharacterized protein dnl_14810 [Desulfonema limicola]
MEMKPDEDAVHILRKREFLALSASKSGMENVRAGGGSFERNFLRSKNCRTRLSDQRNKFSM